MVAGGCRGEIRLPYAIAWLIAALAELAGREGLTRAQVQALSRPRSIQGEHFAQVGFEAKTVWRQVVPGEG